MPEFKVTYNLSYDAASLSREKRKETRVQRNEEKLP